jgi:alpha-tubulin suppressor-like RCC1 family protein
MSSLLGLRTVALAAATTTVLAGALAAPAAAGPAPTPPAGAAPAVAEPPTAARAGAKGLKVTVKRPAEAKKLVRVTVTGPRQPGQSKPFKATTKKTRTWANLRPGVYKVKAKKIVLFDQKVKPKVTKKRVTITANRSRKTSKVTYALPAFCSYDGSTAYAWGEGDHGRLGTASPTDRLAPAPVTRLRGVTAMTGGLRTSYALCGDGTVWSWGFNQNGELGAGLKGDRAHPVRVAGLSSITAIAARREGAMALRSDGTVWAWGAGDYGQLGNAAPFTSTTAATKPVQVSLPARATAIAAGGYNGYALLEDGTVRAWGVRGVGQLGNPATPDDTSTPVAVQGLTAVVEIAAGHATAYARRANASVWAWGYGNQGEIGDGFLIHRTAPVQVDLPGAVTSIGASNAAGYAIVGGGVWSWGSGRHGDVGFDNAGNPQATPVSNVTLSGVVEIVGAGYGGYALTGTGRVWAWGDHGAGQVGNGAPPTGPATTDGVETPVQLGLTGVTGVGAGNVNGYAIG